MRLAVQRVVVNLCVKGILHLPRRAAELDAAAAFGHAVHPKTAVQKPVGDDVQILLGCAESLAKLLRSQPLVVVRRSLLIFISLTPIRKFCLDCAIGTPTTNPNNG